MYLESRQYLDTLKVIVKSYTWVDIFIKDFSMLENDLLHSNTTNFLDNYQCISNADKILYFEGK